MLLPQDTLPCIERWYADVAQCVMSVGSKAPFDYVLIGNKTDLRDPAGAPTDSGKVRAMAPLLYGKERVETCICGTALRKKVRHGFQ